MQHQRNPLRHIQRALAVAAISTGLAAPVCAASWPTQPVTIVVPFSAGGTTDVVARLVGQKLGEMWGQSVVIENKLGAGGNIGTAAVAQAKPDGNTLLMASGSILTVNPHLYKNLPFDAEKDFELVTNVARGPMVIVTAKKVKAKNLKDLIEYAENHPKQLNLGSAGLGSQVHMAGENFGYSADIAMTHVPYRGEAAALADLMAGQIDVIVGNIGAATPLVKDGRVKALAVASAKRAAMLPDVPTADEAGLKGFTNYGWFGFLAPKGTPADVVKKIQTDTTKVLAMPAVKEKLASLGMEGVGNTPQAFKQEVADESKQWAKIIKERKIVIQQ
ncbi:tripartite tricarboxylate transporter substrate binding protein [Pusillimonas sp. TS35]|uniref:Bug family tripartite tricarboxylate transporter substrate binding protein n=1 Tax=Paracandidimonas lactea TaxID=2895524 RepID=UPI00136D1BC3|nr:tripartite tricarboxylate transporter substrate binding protein [Paracandidimonas lactea]MYN12350.1 tripartite tricarboxylate transporter substrate binding protein [Pusillimonas sp. TS35]